MPFDRQNWTFKCDGCEKTAAPEEPKPDDTAKGPEPTPPDEWRRLAPKGVVCSDACRTKVLHARAKEQDKEWTPGSGDLHRVDTEAIAQEQQRVAEEVAKKIPPSPADVIKASVERILDSIGKN